MELRCLRCKKIIPDLEAKKIIEADVEPYCSQYCAEVGSGVPLPYGPLDGVYTDLLNRSVQEEQEGEN